MRKAHSTQRKVHSMMGFGIGTLSFGIIIGICICILAQFKQQIGCLSNKFVRKQL